MIMSYILQRMLCKGCYRISIVIAFSYRRAKIVRIRDVPRVLLEKGGKIPLFNNIRIHVDKDICTHCEIVFIEPFHSRGQHLCKFIGTKESACIRKEFSPRKIVLLHQHGRR